MSWCTLFHDQYHRASMSCLRRFLGYFLSMYGDFTSLYLYNYKATETSTQSVTGHAKRALKSLLRRTSWARMQSCGSMTDDVMPPVIRRRQTQLWPTIVQLFIANKPIQTSAQKQRLKATGCCLKKLKITQRGSSSERSESNGVSIHNISVGSITAQGTCILPLRCSRLEFVF